MDATPSAPAKPTPLDWTFRILGFVILTATAFSLPRFAAGDLDSSWRMAIGKFFMAGQQFGTEVVFTYGPLGWAMAQTYWGDHWSSLIGWHAIQAVIFAGLAYWYAFRLTGYQRVFFLLFFFLFAFTYEDAAHQIVITLVGFELIRRSDAPWRWSSVPLAALLVVLALVKFTNLLLVVFLVLLAGGLGLWKQRQPSALRLTMVFVGLFLVGWVLCGQHLGNLPAYFHSSWEISQGYQNAMGIPCPPGQLIRGLIVAGLVVVYLGLNFATQKDRVRSAALTLAALAYLYLNWKHGYVRADGHQVGFYYAAMTLMVTTPLLLEENERLLRTKRLILAGAGLLSVVSLDLVLPGLSRGILAATQDRVDRSISFAVGAANTRELYDVRFKGQIESMDMTRTLAAVHSASVDVLGFEQAVAVFNPFNYQPRPVFQGYSAYTPYLSHLNYDYYASDRAPEYVLFKFQTLDGRLTTMDDPEVLRLLVQRYTYEFSELGYTIWKRDPGPFHAADCAPKFIRATTVPLGQPVALADLADRNLWVKIDYRFSLLGKLRAFLFKPPLVQLVITDNQGAVSSYRLPQPIGATGFLLNPISDDLLDFMRTAGGTPTRRVAVISIQCAPQDRDCLQDDVAIEISSVPPSNAAKKFFRDANMTKFNMFVDAPVSFHAFIPPNEDVIDGHKVMVLHAPSEMVFDVPAGATRVRGAYGFVAGAYQHGGNTSGASFVIYTERQGFSVVLSERYLDPVHKLQDRGLQKFDVPLPGGTSRVFLRVNPGPYNENAFDWTGWTGVEFK